MERIDIKLIFFFLGVSQCFGPGPSSDFLKCCVPTLKKKQKKTQENLHFYEFYNEKRNIENFREGKCLINMVHFNPTNLQVTY